MVLFIMQIAAAGAGEDLAEAAEVARTGSNAMLYAGLFLLVISIGAAFLIKRVLIKIAKNEGNMEALRSLSGKKEEKQVNIA